MKKSKPKTFKPGERFNAFQAKKMKHKKSYSEADMGSMKGYDPNLGMKPSKVGTSVKPVQNAVKSAAKTVKPTTIPGGSFINGYSATKGSMSNRTNANSTKMMKKKPSKHKKEHSASAIKGMRAFVSEEAKEKKHKKSHKGSMAKCKMCK